MWKWRRTVDQETQYTGPQFYKYKIMSTEVKGDLHPSFPTTDLTYWKQRVFDPGLIIVWQPFCCVSKMTQCVLEEFNVGHSERAGYLHVGKLLSASAQERSLLEFMCFGVVNVYICVCIYMYVFYIRDIQNTYLRTCVSSGALWRWSFQRGVGHWE